MPFQVSYSSKATPVGVINFFDAGADQVTVCDTLVTLTANVNGDLTGHTIIWEQTSGSAVTFITPLNQLSVQYTTATFDDKVFRFTIDKGTASEQFDDVNIFGTPTLPHFFGLPDQNCQINFGNSLRCNAPDLTILDAFPLVEHDGTAECDTSTTPTLAWQPPCELDLIVQYVVQERSVAGAWTDEAILPPTAQTYIPLNIGSTYRVVAVRREINSALSSIPSDTLWVNGEVGVFGRTLRVGKGAAASSSYGVSRGGSKTLTVPTYSVTLVTLLACNPDAPDDHYFGLPGSDKTVTIPTYDVVSLTLISCDPDAPDDHYFGLPGSSKTITVPTYDVLDLTGGDIGG